MKNKLSFILIHFLILANSLYSQSYSIFETSVSIDTLGSEPNMDAILDIKSTKKGILVPRMTTTQRNAINQPSNGLLVYDLDSLVFFYSKNQVWEKIGPSSGLEGPVGPQGPIGLQGPIGPTGAGGATHMSGTNFLVGTNTGSNISSGDYNALVGYTSGTQISTGGFNAFFGGLSGSSTNGSFNVGVGYRAGGTVGQNGTIDHNVSIGSASGAKFVDASYNVLVGSSSGSHLNNGDSNIMIGFASGSAVNTGSNNLYIGNTSGRLNNNGSNNIVIGHNSGQNLSSSNNNLFIGRSAGLALTGSQDKLIIENSSSPNPLVYGDFAGNNLAVNWDWTQPIPNTLSVNGTASKSTAGDWLANSDIRLKAGVTKLSSQKMLKKLLQMQGVSYYWNDDKTGIDRPDNLMFGFIAQDIEKIWPNNVHEDALGYKATSYGTYDYLYVESIKALHNENEELKKELINLRLKIEKLNRKIDLIIETTTANVND